MNKMMMMCVMIIMFIHKENSNQNFSFRNAKNTVRGTAKQRERLVVLVRDECRHVATQRH